MAAVTPCRHSDSAEEYTRACLEVRRVVKFVPCPAPARLFSRFTQAAVLAAHPHEFNKSENIYVQKNVGRMLVQ